MSNGGYAHNPPQGATTVPTSAIKERVNMSDLQRWLCSIGGGALIGYGLTRRSVGGALLAAIGGYSAYAGVKGYAPDYQMVGGNVRPDGDQTIIVERTLTIDRPVDELYNFWRNFENLPQFMQHLESVTITGERTSHWVANGPGGKLFEWDAEITQEQPNEVIAWRSLPGSEIHSAGTVRFERSLGDRGTIVRVTMQYDPPAGIVGVALAKLTGREPAQEVETDLRRFKQFMETGVIATTKGQPSGQRSLIGKVVSPDA